MVKVSEVIAFARDLADRGVGTDADGVYGTQCVDLPNMISHKFFGKWLWGNAIDLLNSAKGNGYTVKYDAPDDINPKAGDVFVMEVNGHPYGHTGLVIEDSDGFTIKTIEQNVDGNWDALTVGGPARYVTRDFDGIVGWFRFPYEDDGASKTGWNEDNTGYWYVRPDGTYYKNQFAQVYGTWYYFGEDGYMYASKWLHHTDDKWYYFKADGEMAKGWQIINDKWYYFGDGGAMVTGWVKYKDTWYFCDYVNGDMKSDAFIKGVDGWYYVNADGSMAMDAQFTVEPNGLVTRV